MIEIFLTLRMIYVLTTIALIEKFGAVETNPLMRVLIEWGWEYFILFQIIALYVVLVLTEQYQSKWIKWTVVIANILSGAVVMGNLLALFVSI